MTAILRKGLLDGSHLDAAEPGRGPPGRQLDGRPAGSVKVVDFTLLGQRFQAIGAGPHHEFNDAVSIVVLCDDQAELDRYWNALLEGGALQKAYHS
jgi:predicted 3-demethylubiquinone-9 3-methyltransferase (glyoxalase superfamily)